MQAEGPGFESPSLHHIGTRNPEKGPRLFCWWGKCRSVTAWRWFDHRLAGHCFRLNAAQANRDQLSPASRSLMRKQMSSRAGGTARGQGGAERQEDRPARFAHDVAESAPCSTRRLTLRALGTSLKTTSYVAVRVPGGLEGAAFQDQGFLAAIRHIRAG